MLIKKDSSKFYGRIAKNLVEKRSEALFSDNNEVKMDNFVFINTINKNACDRKP